MLGQNSSMSHNSTNKEAFISYEPTPFKINEETNEEEDYQNPIERAIQYQNISEKIYYHNKPRPLKIISAKRQQIEEIGNIGNDGDVTDLESRAQTKLSVVKFEPETPATPMDKIIWCKKPQPKESIIKMSFDAKKYVSLDPNAG